MCEQTPRIVQPAEYSELNPTNLAVVVNRKVEGERKRERRKVSFGKK